MKPNEEETWLATAALVALIATAVGVTIGLLLDQPWIATIFLLWGAVTIVAAIVRAVTLEKGE